MQLFGNSASYVYIYRMMSTNPAQLAFSLVACEAQISLATASMRHFVLGFVLYNCMRCHKLYIYIYICIVIRNSH